MCRYDKSDAYVVIRRMDRHAAPQPTPTPLSTNIHRRSCISSARRANGRLNMYKSNQRARAYCQIPRGYDVLCVIPAVYWNVCVVYHAWYVSAHSSTELAGDGSISIVLLSANPTQVQSAMLNRDACRSGEGGRAALRPPIRHTSELKVKENRATSKRATISCYFEA